MNKLVELNDIVKYSPWPARLLGIEKWEQRKKDAEEITREYEHEKWGPLLKKVKESKGYITVDDINRWVFGDLPDIACAVGNNFEVMQPYDAYLRYLEIVRSTLEKYSPVKNLVELGAGYGSILLPLSMMKSFEDTKIFAGEYTKSGVELIDILAKADGINLNCSNCDFNANPITEMDIPEGAVIFTSFATISVSKLRNDFIENLCSYNPSVVIHFEPCYEHNDITTLIGQMRHRYIEINDYNTNLISSLYTAQAKNLIRLVDEKPIVFGNNPFLPASIVSWIPLKQE